MAFKKGQSGNPNGKPKGALSKPRLADYVSQKDLEAIVAKAIELAKAGNERMITFVGEQVYGKAIQPTDMNIVGDVHIHFSQVFDKKK